MTDGVPTHCSQGSCVSELVPYGTQFCQGFCDTNGQSGCGASINGCNDNACAMPEGNSLYSTSRAIADQRATFFTIAFGLVEDCSRATYLLGTMANLSGGEYGHSRSPQELRRIYQDIAYRIVSTSEIRNRTVSPYLVSDSANLTIRYVAPSRTCGNGIRESGEDCDDGNTDNTDRCSNICLNTFCGDSYRQTPNGRGIGGPFNDGQEECDDANGVDGDECSNSCVFQFCGDAYVQPLLGEECDHVQNPTLCNDECLLTVPPGCGNGVIEYLEQCDDGNRMNGDGCSSTCTLEISPGCGNAVQEPGEECDDGNTNPYDGCHECRRSAFNIDLVDTTVRFGYSSFPAHNYQLSSMIANPATLPCEPSSITYTMSPSTQYSITQTPVGSSGIQIVPFIGSWFEPLTENINVRASCSVGGVEFTDIAILTVIYDAGDTASMLCAATTPRYLLEVGRTRSVGFSSIFQPYAGQVISAEVRDAGSLTLTQRLPTGLDVLASSAVSSRLQVRVRLDTNTVSPFCPAEFASFDSRCGGSACDACIASEDLACMQANGCLDREIRVLNPLTPLRFSTYLPPGAPGRFVVDSFRAFPGFTIRPSSGNMATIFEINDTTGLLPHNTRSASVAVLSLPGFEGTARVCPELVRYSFTAGSEGFDPDTPLLITDSKSVIGFFEKEGYVFSKGPYIFLAKVWQR
jgi:cysteine-rich repeat protein